MAPLLDREKLFNLAETAPPCSAPCSPLDALKQDEIPPAEWFEWQPPELVAVLGEHAWRHWCDVTHVAFSSDGRRVASVGEDGVRVWDRRAATGSPQEAFHLPGACRFIAFSEDWRAVLTLGDGDKGEAVLQVWDLSRSLPTPVSQETCDWTWAEQSEGRTVESGTRATAVAINPSGRLMALGHANGSVRVRKVDQANGTWDLKLRAPNKPVTALAFSADERQLAVGLADGQVQLWELVGPLPRPSTPYRASPEGIAGLTFSSDGTVLAVACRMGPVRLLGIAGLVVCAECAFPVSNGADAVSFAPDGSLLAVWAEGEGTKVFNMASTIPEFLWEIESRGPSSVRPGLPMAFSPSGTTLAVGGSQGKVALWDLAPDGPTAINAAQGPGGAVGWLAFSPDGSLLATAARTAARSKDQLRDNPIRVWALKPGESFRQLAELDGGGPLTFSADGKTLAGCDDKRQLRLWKRDGDAFRPLALTKAAATPPADDGPAELTFIDRRIVYACDLAGSPHVTAGPKVEGTILAASPGGAWVVTGQPAAEPQTVTLWSHNGRQATPQNTAEVRGEVLAASPDGTLLLTSSGCGKLMIWKVLEAEPVRTWWFPGRVLGAAFAYDGRHLALGNANGTIYVLRLPDEVVGSSRPRGPS
jgi:WD40 repeat protein